jgi:hypothetical protein
MGQHFYSSGTRRSTFNHADGEWWYPLLVLSIKPIVCGVYRIFAAQNIANKGFTGQNIEKERLNGKSPDDSPGFSLLVLL